MQDMNDVDDHMGMCAISQEKIQVSANAFGMIRPDDDITLIGGEFVTLDKSRKAFGSIMPSKFGEEDLGGKPILRHLQRTDLPPPRILMTQSRSTCLNTLEQHEMREVRKIVEEHGEQEHGGEPPAPIGDVALQNLHYVCNRLGGVVNQLEILKHEIGIFKDIVEPAHS